VLDARVPTMLEDANRFFTAHGRPGFRPGRYTENLPPGFDCDEWPDGDNPEAAVSARRSRSRPTSAASSRAGTKYCQG